MPATERRRDQRVRVFGTAAFATGAFEELSGSLLDVSAGGARVRLPRRPDAQVGATLPVSLSVADMKAPPGALPVRLRGRARLLRVVDDATGHVETAIRFVEPLLVTEACRSVAPILR
jgi:hypothetical protein